MRVNECDWRNGVYENHPQVFIHNWSLREYPRQTDRVNVNVKSIIIRICCALSLSFSFSRALSLLRIGGLWMLSLLMTTNQLGFGVVVPTKPMVGCLKEWRKINQYPVAWLGIYLFIMNNTHSHIHTQISSSSSLWFRPSIHSAV